MHTVLIRRGFGKRASGEQLAVRIALSQSGAIKLRYSAHLYLFTACKVSTMINNRKGRALAARRKLLKEPEILKDAQEQYDELLKLADEYKRTSVIHDDDWRDLV